MTGVTIAAFDFDGTLARRDSVVPFLRRVAGTRSSAIGLLRRAHRLPPVAARRDRDRLRAIATEIVFARRPIVDVLAHADAHASEITHSGLRPDTLARLAWHRDAGHRVVIVSASYGEYLDGVADRLGVDDVLATRLEVEAGVCTGRLAGANCRGAEKERRLQAWLAREGIDPDRLTIWAYGDSSGDRELLAMADHPVWVKRPLASVAPTN